MKRSTGESVKRSRSRPGNALDGTGGAAAATEMPAASRRPTIACRYMVAPRALQQKNRSRSAGEDLDLTVDAGDHLEFAFVGLVLVAGEHAIAAFRQDHPRERTDRFLDHVAGRAQHRP